MTSYFSPDFFAGNRENLRALLTGGEIVVLTAAGSLQRSGDTTYPFSQDRNFWYVTGIDTPDVVLVLTADDEYIVLPEQDDMRDVFDGAIDPNELSRRSGVAKCYSQREGWDRLKSNMQGCTAVATALPGALRHAHGGFYLNPARKQLAERLKRTARNVDFQDIRTRIARLRAAKQPAELAAITAAVKLTTDTLSELRSAKQLGLFRYEYELEAAISHGMRQRGAAGHAYSPIIASGPHATTLHYTANNGKIDRNHLIVVDVGAEVENYAADITRTLCVSEPTKRQAEVLAAVRTVQQEALATLKAGILLKDYEQTVTRAMGEALVGLGLSNDKDDHVTLRRYYPHATSHFLGLDVHDVGDYMSVLEPNMVVTCEPGIYIPEEGIGVRLEDDVIITNTGVNNLSTNCSYDAYVL
ncbi:aminopeptidase P family protein [Candidatus Saccharibacteria bacterium]|nr:MAG: aminopeptidase P family protein [Candidatus Saccharibacteria bacterium]